MVNFLIRDGPCTKTNYPAQEVTPKPDFLCKAAALNTSYTDAYQVNIKHQLYSQQNLVKQIWQSFMDTAYPYLRESRDRLESL